MGGSNETTLCPAPPGLAAFWSYTGGLHHRLIFDALRGYTRHRWKTGTSMIFVTLFFDAAPGLYSASMEDGYVHDLRYALFRRRSGAILGIDGRRVRP